MFLNEGDLERLVAWRRRMHAHPEISGEERETARRVVEFLEPTAPDQVLTGFGGHGLAAIYEGAAPGPALMIRAELDALPICETGMVAYRSTIEGKGHLCGHDGHMAILAALALGFGRQRSARGRLILLFQPAEETGAGAAAVLADPRFESLRPDMVLALHNVPGVAHGHVELREGVVNCASRGMRTVLGGRTAHASMPETGVSPMAAVAKLMPALTALGEGVFPGDSFAMATVTHARLGEAAFGIAPGEAEIMVTLRSFTDAGMERLCRRAEELVQGVAHDEGLRCTWTYHDVFAHCDNDARAVALLRTALDAEGIPRTPGMPLRASEDFGRFASVASNAMFFLGAGEDHPSLHNPDYDFPDGLIPIGARIFMRAAREMLG